ncbi:hypothetical protein HY003_02750 [Candidatus Saccharibacteria bacterium]|nr:hypothetical protein [Candidatus Saccharibacteria bacterium]MBI3338193.1 hypothetical protein [Candidatus Saccharibacteria bacterium]
MFGHDDHEKDNNDSTVITQSPIIADPDTSNSTDMPTISAPLPPASSNSPDDTQSGSDTDMLSSVPSNDLVSIKQEALKELTPLVGHLDQSPEEKFRTLMMMIQASDDQTKLKEVFEAAKQISDDKARAQALLDVINEINYFTQQASS